MSPGAGPDKTSKRVPTSTGEAIHGEQGEPIAAGTDGYQWEFRAMLRALIDEKGHAHADLARGVCKPGSIKRYLRAVPQLPTAADARAFAENGGAHDPEAFVSAVKRDLEARRARKIGAHSSADLEPFGAFQALVAGGVDRQRARDFVVNATVQAALTDALTDALSLAFTPVEPAAIDPDAPLTRAPSERIADVLRERSSSAVPVGAPDGWRSIYTPDWRAKIGQDYAQLAADEHERGITETAKADIAASMRPDPPVSEFDKRVRGLAEKIIANVCAIDGVLIGTLQDDAGLRHIEAGIAAACRAEDLERIGHVVAREGAGARTLKARPLTMMIAAAGFQTVAPEVIATELEKADRKFERATLLASAPPSGA